MAKKVETAPVTHGGSFVLLREIEIELSPRPMAPYEYMRTLKHFFMCEDFHRRIFPLLHNKHQAKDDAEKQATLRFWRSEKLLSHADLVRRFEGKDKPVQPWAIAPMLAWMDKNHHENYDSPFTIDSKDGAICFLEHFADGESHKLSAVHMYGAYATMHSEWRLNVFDGGDGGQVLCPDGAIYVSQQ